MSAIQNAIRSLNFDKITFTTIVGSQSLAAFFGGADPQRTYNEVWFIIKDLSVLTSVVNIGIGAAAIGTDFFKIEARAEKIPFILKFQSFTQLNHIFVDDAAGGNDFIIWRFW